MSLSAAMNNMFSMDRQRARYESERIVNGEEETDTPSAVESDQEDVETGAATTTTASTSTDENLPEAGRRSRSNATASSSRSRRSAGANENEDNSVLEGEADADAAAASRVEGEEDDDDAQPATDAADRLFATAAHNQIERSSSNTMTLAELEEQRELSRRRSSACVLLAVFVLFRLWIECLQKQDPTLLLLCLMGTSWTARWIRYNRDREEELDRRIEAYLQNNNNSDVVDRNDYARLSFQAQLALAVMESQRHMMEGGFGRPDGVDQAPGVSEEAKRRWKIFQWQQGNNIKGDYGALPTKGSEDTANMDNHCSICLSEYEDSETLIQLPCHHVYHDECIQSWTTNHLKCPLCNFDLESVPSGGENDSIV
jgi:hypothetical protein